MTEFDDAIKELVELRLERIRSTPSITWDSISVDAITYPDHIRSVHDPMVRMRAEAIYDDSIANKISMAIDANDCFELGSLLMQSAKDYRDYLIQDI